MLLAFLTAFAEPPAKPAAEPVLPPMNILGAVEPQAVHAAVLEAMPTLVQCYGTNGIQDRTGAVTLKFLVGKTGKVDNSTLKHSELGSIEIETCLVEAFGKLVVPTPAGAGISVVTYAFVPHEAGRPALATE